MWRSGRDALDALGVGDRLRAASFPVAQGVLRTASGRELRTIRPSLWFVPRSELVAALEDALPATTTRLTRLVTDPRGLATEVGADLVVGADGVRSEVRQRTWPGSAPVVTDWIALRGHLPGPVTGTATEWWGRGGLFGTTPGPRGAAWFCAIRGGHRGMTIDHDEALTLAHRQFADWDPRTREVLDAVGDLADAQRILLAPLLRTSTADGLVLIGDAAHAMSPNLGRGANEALEDAVVLARMIHRHGTKGAPRAFARRRHLRGQMLRAGSLPALRLATSGLWSPPAA